MGSPVVIGDADDPREFHFQSSGQRTRLEGRWPAAVGPATDPYRRYCAVRKAQMVPLPTIASWEWDGGQGHGWAPPEDQAAAKASHYAGQDLAQPTGVEVGSTDNVQICFCPTSPEHPPIDLIQ